MQIHGGDGQIVHPVTTPLRHLQHPVLVVPWQHAGRVPLAVFFVAAVQIERLLPLHLVHQRQLRRQSCLSACVDKHNSYTNSIRWSVVVTTVGTEVLPGNIVYIHSSCHSPTAIDCVAAAAHATLIELSTMNTVISYLVPIPCIHQPSHQ